MADQDNVPTPILRSSNGELIHQIQILGAHGLPIDLGNGAFIGTRVSADIPSAYPIGLSIARAGYMDAGFPYDGFAFTIQPQDLDGIFAIQFNWAYGNANSLSYRSYIGDGVHGSGAGAWSPWAGIGTFLARELSNSDSITSFPFGTSISIAEVIHGYPIDGNVITSKILNPAGLTLGSQTLTSLAGTSTYSRTWNETLVSWGPWHTAGYAAASSLELLAATIDAYPMGYSSTQQLATNGWPADGVCFTFKGLHSSGAGLGFQTFIPASGSYEYVRSWSINLGAWSPWSQAAGNPAVTVPALLNAWVAYGFGYATPGYWMDSAGVVHLEGVVKSGTIGVQAADQILALPVGYRPITNHLFPVVSGDAFGECIINVSGEVYPAVGSTLTFSLDGVSFRTR